MNLQIVIVAIIFIESIIANTMNDTNNRIYRFISIRTI